MKDNILLYSNPNIVLNNAREFFGNDVEIDYSDKIDKKYKILNPDTNKWVHFGAMGYEDYTKHKDDNRRKKFLIRNKEWSKQDMYTPGFLSYYLLW
jgi:hypothetical protein